MAETLRDMVVSLSLNSDNFSATAMLMLRRMSLLLLNTGERVWNWENLFQHTNVAF